MMAWLLLLALGVGVVRCDPPASRPRKLWNIKTDSLSDIFRGKADHKVFVGKIKENNNNNNKQTTKKKTPTTITTKNKTKTQQQTNEQTNKETNKTTTNE